MKRCLVLVLALFWLIPSSLSAASTASEDQFFEATALALEAEKARSAADWTRAQDRYRKAIAVLEQLRAAPTPWNSQLVDYRLRQYRDQLEQLQTLAGVKPPGQSLSPTTQLEQFKAGLIQTETQVAATQTARQELQTTNQWLRAQLTAMRQKVEALTDEVSELTRLKADLAQARSAADQAAQLTGQNQKLNEELAQLRQQATASQASSNRLVALTQQHTALQQQLAEAERAARQLRERATALELSDLRNTFMELGAGSQRKP